MLPQCVDRMEWFTWMIVKEGKELATKVSQLLFWNRELFSCLNYEYVYFVAISKWALDKSIAKLRVFPRFYKKILFWTLDGPSMNPSWPLHPSWTQNFIKRYYPEPLMVRLQKQHLGITHFDMLSSVYSGFCEIFG